MGVSPTPVLAESLTSSDAAIGASAMRKATLRLIPLIALGYGTAYMDRVNISFAALQMNRELHFSATVYGLGAGLFFLSYAACEIPSHLLLYPPPLPLRSAPLSQPHHGHLGIARHGHALRPHPVAVLHRAFPPRHGRSRLLPRHHLLPHAMVPAPSASPRHQP